MCGILMSDDVFTELFNKFTKNEKFALPVIRETDEKYEDKLKSIYEEYYGLLEKYNTDQELTQLINSAKILCESILEILEASEEKRISLVDEILRCYFDNSTSGDLLVYSKKGVKGEFLDPEYYHSKKKDQDLLFLYRSMNRVNAINNEDSNEGKLRQMFHCPYNLSPQISSTRYSMKGVPSLYMSTSMNLSFSELRNLKPGDEVYISKFKINRDPTVAVKQIKVLEFGIVPNDFNKKSNVYEEDKDLAINKYPVFRNGLLKKTEVKKTYLFWYPLFAACSFIRTIDSEVNKSQEYPEYIIPQLFLTRLNEKSASTGIVYGIRYFSCADEKSYLKGFNYVFPCGETIENINKSKFLFSEKLVDSFKLTLPERYKVNFSESDLKYTLKSDNDISSEDWERLVKDGKLDEDAFIKELDVHESWNEFVHHNKEIIRRVIDQIKMNEKLTPKNPKKVFRFLTRDLTKVKVVILGQDPYPQENVATGRAFEINEINKWEDIFSNSSLLNILKSLYRNFNNKVLTKKQLDDELRGGDFQILPPTSWFDSMENQGILFLNSYFTCDIGKRSCQKKNHKEIWKEFSCKLLNEISNRNTNVKWFVWGNEAKKLVTQCKVKDSIYYSYHPSVFRKTSSIIYFDWTGNADKIKWLGIKSLEKVEETLEKGKYYSIENTKLVADD